MQASLPLVALLSLDQGGHVVHTPMVHNSAIRKGNWKLVRMNEKVGANIPPGASTT